VRERRGAARRPAAARARGAGGPAMGEVAALRQLVGQVQELWDLYGANAHPVPRQGERTKSLLSPSSSRTAPFGYSAPTSRSRPRPPCPRPRLARICSLRGVCNRIANLLASLAVFFCWLVD
jgi:hypothetical protein